jgi:hypothetical protein|tara:strand:+ start:153 stop:908 length:756 start_codon:yes stop_codon:yes gene_type:complete
MTIEIPKLISLDIIDLNKRLRNRYREHKQLMQNYLDILPYDVMKLIVNHKIRIDFNSDYDSIFVRKVFNGLYEPDTIYKIAFTIICNKALDFQFKPEREYDDFNQLYMNKAKLDFVKNKLIETETDNFDYLKYFSRYVKTEVISKRFEIGNVYHKAFKDRNTKIRTIIPFVIIERQKILFGDITYYDIIANIINTDVVFRSRIVNEYQYDLEDDKNVYIIECSKLKLQENPALSKYLKDNNLSAVRYNIES